ncbi:MAG: universal stress protein [Fimbriimonas sp.]
MKTILGIDFEGHYEAALRLLASLRFSPNSVELLHADEPFATYVPLAYVPLETDGTRHDMAMALLEAAREKGCTFGLRVEDQRYAIDPPAKALIEESMAQHVDLVAIGAREKTKYGGLFLGSVGRALTIGSPASVLVAKDELISADGQTVVLATDHSEYADEAVRLFVRMNPKGIKRLVLVTAISPKASQAALEEERRRHSQASLKMVEHLKSFDLPAEYRVVEGEPDDVLAATMKDVGGDLLAMGAQGHGFLERVMLGSLSLQQVMASPFSTLILRPKR